MDLYIIKFGMLYRKKLIGSEYRYIESIHNMRKPVISSEISPKFDRVQTTDILPEKQLSEITKKLHICSAYPRVSRTLIFTER